MALAAAIIGVSLAISAVVNPLFGRFVHWDWVAAGGPVGFVLLTIAFRRRWV